MKILFFDGYCSLCNSFIDRMIRFDKENQLKFSSLQSKTAKKHLHSSQLPLSKDPTTIIYFRDGIVFSKSTAVLQSLIDLGGIWSTLKIFLFLPVALRDVVYDFIAKNRYRFFGRRDTCRLPTAEEQSHFLP